MFVGVFFIEEEYSGSSGDDKQGSNNFGLGNAMTKNMVLRIHPDLLDG